jgi:hypothetical protein
LPRICFHKNLPLRGFETCSEFFKQFVKAVPTDRVLLDLGDEFLPKFVFIRMFPLSGFDTCIEFSNRCGNSRIDADGSVVKVENVSRNIKELDKNVVIYR